MLLGLEATTRGPERSELCSDPLPEHVPGPGQRKRHVGVQALQALGSPTPRDPKQQGLTTVVADVAPGEGCPDRALLRSRSCERLEQLGIGGRTPTPALDATLGLESGDADHQMAAREVESRRKGLAV
jgi:hypothetical protein